MGHRYRTETDGQTPECRSHPALPQSTSLNRPPSSSPHRPFTAPRFCRTVCFVVSYCLDQLKLQAHDCFVMGEERAMRARSRSRSPIPPMRLASPRIRQAAVGLVSANTYVGGPNHSTTSLLTNVRCARYLPIVSNGCMIGLHCHVSKIARTLFDCLGVSRLPKAQLLLTRLARRTACR